MTVSARFGALMELIGTSAISASAVSPAVSSTRALLFGDSCSSFSSSNFRFIPCARAPSECDRKCSFSRFAVDSFSCPLCLRLNGDLTGDLAVLRECLLLLDLLGVSFLRGVLLGVLHLPAHFSISMEISCASEPITPSSRVFLILAGVSGFDGRAGMERFPFLGERTDKKPLKPLIRSFYEIIRIYIA